MSIIEKQKELKSLIVECRRKRFNNAGYSFNEKESYEIAQEVLDPIRNQRQLDIIQRFIQPTGNERLLEIGSGHGYLLYLLNKAGFNALGIEADADILSVSKKILAFYRISPEKVSHAYGEKLPFPNNYFDVVFSANVLEHVQDVDVVIDESIRVTRAGGIIIHNFPNYRSFYEGHFKTIWFPFLNYRSGKWFLIFMDKIFRNPHKRSKCDYDYINTLQFTSLKTIRYAQQRHPEIQIITRGEEFWLESMEKFNFSIYTGMEILKKVIKVLTFLRLNKTVGKLGIILGFFTPIIMVIQKPNLRA